MHRVVLGLLGSTALLSVLAAPAAADCDNLSPGKGDTVTCSANGGVETRAIDDGSKKVTVIVETGAEINVAGDDAIKLRDKNNKILNSGTIRGGDEAIVGGNKLNVENKSGAKIIAADHGIVGETEDKVIVKGDEERVPAANMTIVNEVNALIQAGGDAIKAGDGLSLTNDGTITAGDDLVQGEAIRTDAGGTSKFDDATDVRVTNTGTMVAVDKGITVGDRLTLDNAGLITSQENEAVEAGDDAHVVNSGTIDGFDDAVQVGEAGVITNSGTIRNTQTQADLDADPKLEAQDAIDLDSGTINNLAGGRILSSVGDAIDFDEAAGAGVINNAGEISGRIAVETDPANIRTQQITNSGTITGLSGVAFNLGGGDDSYLHLAGASLTGGANYGSGEDLMTIATPFAGIFGGAGSLFDGGTGLDTLELSSYAFDDLVARLLPGGELRLQFGNTAGAEPFQITTLNFERFVFAGDNVKTLAEITSIAAVPLPASLMLLGGALFGLGALRRRG